MDSDDPSLPRRARKGIGAPVALMTAIDIAGLRGQDDQCGVHVAAGHAKVKRRYRDCAPITVGFFLPV
jgi:hypothetical protein